jgi:hypothetical protein
MLTQQEKINEIYEYITKKKAQEKRQFIIKWLFRIFFIFYLIYLYFSIIPNYMEKYKIKNIWEKIKTNYSKISDNS